MRVPLLMQNSIDSQPGVSGGHEEGGFVLRDANGNVSVSRWQQGEQDRIILPTYQDCRFEGQEIIATLHTHPNTGGNYLQEPSETDKRAVRDDPNLKAAFYEGELVISQEKIYLIESNGQVREIGDTRIILQVDLEGTMAAVLTPDVLQDDIAVSLARAIAAANKRARDSGVDVLQSIITITQRALDGDTLWRINYGPREYIGRRGGDLIVEVDSSDSSIKQVLRGQ